MGKKDKKKPVNAYEIVSLLDKLKELNGDQWIIIETPTGSASLQLKDALIYEGCWGEIVLDSE